MYMPKIVDHEHQKEKVAEAAWRVIRKYGIEQASVRKVAEEAGVSPGSMRHYFTTQSELYAYSMRLVSERVKERAHHIHPKGNLKEDILEYLRQVLPLNEETRLEMEVWFAFVAKSMSDSSLKALRNQVDDDLRQLFRMLVEALINTGLVSADLDHDLEAERFYALIDGLAIHAVLRPEVLTSEKVEFVMKHHLSSLCRS
ncbi:TetR/AcrR family transcriptional regulator [Paenibacillus sp. DYY-L-2]|uniref:TetR/AcrR family transcriptional regulator n=1 Tax=Paenibacillus sp. DYY-L-2 TaxID=3447013 RepID=UPI003F502997